jgi:hypothetical protein
VASTEERLARELAEQLEKLRVEDVLLQTVVTVSSLGYRSLGLSEETRARRDLAQSRLAVDALQSLVEVLEGVVPAELVRDLSASVANLQLAFAKAATEAGERGPGGGAAGTAGDSEPGAGAAEGSDPEGGAVGEAESEGGVGSEQPEGGAGR